MSRWAYLIPRLIILALLAVAIFASADPLARKTIIQSLEDATGTKVNIAQVKCSLSNQKIYLKGLTIADPKNPMNNLVQADMAYLNLDPKALLNRKVVIEYGQASKVMFGVPRTQTGALNGLQPIPVHEEKEKWVPKTFTPIEQISQAWVDQLTPVSSAEPTSNNSSLRIAAEKAVPAWKRELDEVSSAILALQKQKSEFNAIARSNFGNPLRQTQVDTHSIDQANAGVKALEVQLAALVSQIEIDRGTFDQAFQNDTIQLKQSTNQTSFDGNSVSKLLLSEMHEEYVGDVIGWLYWFQSAIPDPKSDLQAKPKRGINIPLVGIKQTPGFLIKTIDLEGEGWFANQHVDFAGTANNLTSQPQFHDEPASFDIRAQGDQHFIVSCVLDRRGEQPVDTLGVLCPDLEIPSRILGDKRSMQVTLGPESRVQADINIQVVGDQLSGELVFRHSNVSFHVDELHEFAGGKNTALQMNRGLASINRFESKIRLSGSLSDYNYVSESDLGQQFAQSVNLVLSEKNNLASSQSLHNLENMYHTQISQIDDEVLPLIHRLQQTLKSETIEIANLKENLIPFGDGPTGIRRR